MAYREFEVICYPDHLGTPRAITTSDATNAKVWEWSNTEPFGANLPNENPSGLGQFVFNLRFPGQQYDQETGTNYNYFRDYDPTIGRYVQSDPIGLRGGLNTYRYVHNNPLMRKDPTGLAETCSILFSLNGSWGNGELLRSTGLNDGWNLDLVHTSLTQSGKLGFFKPGGRVDCFATFSVNYLDEYKKSRQVQTLQQCTDTCQASLRYVVSSYIEEEFYVESRKEITRSAASMFAISSATEILGQIKCVDWLKTLK